MPLKYTVGKKGSGLTLSSLLYSHYSELHCKIHSIRLIHNRIIIYGENNTQLEIGYCYKCNKEYCEYSDVSPIYISNYEWYTEFDY